MWLLKYFKLYVFCTIILLDSAALDDALNRTDVDRYCNLNPWDTGADLTQI